MRVTRRRGYALITALSVLAIMTVLSFAFQSAMELDAEVATAALWDVQARYVAAGGVAEARAAVQQGRDIGALATEHAVAGGRAVVLVEDLRGKLHLNRASAAEVAALLGAEADAVERTRPFATVRDTQAALGLSPEREAVARRATTVHGDGGVHFGVAPVEVLAALEGVSVSQAEAIDRHRRGPDGALGTADDVHVNSAAGLRAIQGIDGATAARLATRIGADDTWVRVLATGSAGPRGTARRTYRIEVVLHRAETRWETVTWLEDVRAE